MPARVLPFGLSMIWAFTRNEEILRLELRYDTDRSEYVLRMLYPDGREEVERYTNLVTFRRRLLALESDLAAEGWQQSRPAVFLRDGWHVT